MPRCAVFWMKMLPQVFEHRDQNALTIIASNLKLALFMPLIGDLRGEN